MKDFFQFLVTLAIMFGMAWLLSINPDKEYGWFMGLIHGGLLVPNWIISLFDSEWLIKAPLHTTMYNVDWWICAVIDSVWVLICAVVSVLAMLFARKR